MGETADKIGVWLGKKIGSIFVGAGKSAAKTKKDVTKFSKGWKRVFKWNRDR